MSFRGVDISKYNSRCDFEVAKKSGLDFVIIKAGSGFSGEDPKWVEYYNKAKRAGLKVGAYWYCYATTIESARKEAKMFLHSLEGMKFDYPVYLDLEDLKCQGRLTKKGRTDIAVEFLSILEKKGYYVGIYSMKYWFECKFDMERLSRFDIWIARWGSKSHGYVGKGLVGMWQYTNQGKWKGIGNTGEGGVDSNISFIDYPKIIVEGGFNGYR